MHHPTDIASLDAARQRRHFIGIARASETWRQIRASWALEGIEADDFTAEIAGRMLAGMMTLEQACAAIRRRHGLAGPH